MQLVYEKLVIVDEYHCCIIVDESIAAGSNVPSTSRTVYNASYIVLTIDALYTCGK